LIHGNAQTYRNNQCRCRPCTEAHSAEAKRYRSRKRAGLIDPRVDAADLRDALLAAVDLGWSKHDLTKVLDYDRRSLQRLLANPDAQTHASTRDRLMSILASLEAPAPRAIMSLTANSPRGSARKVPAFPQVTMIKSLMAAGYPGELLTQRLRDLGYPNRYLPVGHSCDPSAAMYVTTARMIMKLHGNLEGRLGPSWRTAVRLYRNGWFPPACYDEEDPLFSLIPEAVPSPTDFLASWAGPRSPMYASTLASGLLPLATPGSRQYEAVLRTLNRAASLRTAQARPAQMEQAISEAALRRRAKRELWSPERHARELARVRAWKQAQQAS